MNRTRLLLIRHAEAANKGLVAGTHTCQGLSDLGHRQAQALAARLRAEQPSLGITAVYTTAVPRARQTAEYIAAAVGLVVRAELPGPNYGQAEGKLLTDILAQRDTPPALEPDAPLAPGAEPWTALTARVARELDMITTRHVGEVAVVVCHRQNIVAATQHLLGAPATVARASIELGPASITDWEQRPIIGAQQSTDQPPRWILRRCNDDRHLDESTDIQSWNGLCWGERAGHQRPDSIGGGGKSART
ncbi:histidine phosphatase family protein [Nocardia vermiculata]|uniref:Histidine phosphatase family protein n=1 Tax=Nocardia vermiculata TaxID=257274 RepID=A0A846Y3W6_9NOCA|nr:histidine phosphatase family protein [Nocardia vermiculata]NKY53933.1 histidine phosphatase family protein [Nocardia vermiculata]